MRTMRGSFLAVCISILIPTLLMWEGQAQSQEAFPTKPVEIIVPVAAGGSTDAVARNVAPFLSKKWGVPVNVVNKPGGNYVIGSLAVLNAKPDGYTMLLDGNPTNSMLGVAVKDLPFKIMDRTFVSMVTTNAQIFVVPANSPFKNLKDLAAEAKRNPKDFMWAMIGIGTDSASFALRQFFKEIDFDPQKGKTISVSGGSQVVIMVAGGHAMLGSTTIGSAASSLKAGTVKGLAITAKNRDPDWPDIPTTAESGYPNVNIMQWNGISGPLKLPAFIIAKWEKALEEISRDPEFIAKLRTFGNAPAYLDSKATTEYVIKEMDELSALWGAIK